MAKIAFGYINPQGVKDGFIPLTQAWAIGHVHRCWMNTVIA